MGSRLSIKNKIRSKSLNILLNTANVKRRFSELKRQIGGKAHEVAAFLELDDPYSYLLSHYLPALSTEYDVDLKLRLTQALGDDAIDR